MHAPVSADDSPPGTGMAPPLNADPIRKTPPAATVAEPPGRNDLIRPTYMLPGHSPGFAGRSVPNRVALMPTYIASIEAVIAQIAVICLLQCCEARIAILHLDAWAQVYVAAAAPGAAVTTTPAAASGAVAPGAAAVTAASVVVRAAVRLAGSADQAGEVGAGDGVAGGGRPSAAGLSSSNTGSRDRKLPVAGSYWRAPSRSRAVSGSAGLPRNALLSSHDPGTVPTGMRSLSRFSQRRHRALATRSPAHGPARVPECELRTRNGIDLRFTGPEPKPDYYITGSWF